MGGAEPSFLLEQSFPRCYYIRPDVRSALIVVQEGIANPGGTQLGMLGGAPAPPDPPLRFRLRRYGRTATDVITMIIHG